MHQKTGTIKNTMNGPLVLQTIIASEKEKSRESLLNSWKTVYMGHKGLPSKNLKPAKLITLETYIAGLYNRFGFKSCR